MEEPPWVPPWFFLAANLRVVWIDLVEKWIYLEVEAQCPRCLYTEKSVWVVDSLERDVVKEFIWCRSCGYPLGELVYRELEWILAEIESLVERCISED